jgi:hypothetical protein
LEAGLFEFLKGETATLADFHVVPQSRTTDDGTKEGGGTGCKSRGTLGSGIATTLFARGLVEPCPDTTLPVLLLDYSLSRRYLSEMVVGKLFVSVESHDEMTFFVVEMLSTRG